MITEDAGSTAFMMILICGRIRVITYLRDFSDDTFLTIQRRQERDEPDRKGKRKKQLAYR